VQDGEPGHGDCFGVAESVICPSAFLRVGYGLGVSRRVVLPPDQYVASLARKRMAAGALFRDAAGGVLLVNPVYKPTWGMPGGAVEAEESPHAACRREVAEELGLDRVPGRVLAVDWVPSVSRLSGCPCWRRSRWPWAGCE
jgi:hypothetical protein